MAHRARLGYPPAVRGLAFLALLLALPCLAAQAPLAFSTAGGDAWTFRKTIDVAVPDDRCDDVAITSANETVVALPHGRHVRAQILLGPGDNRVWAECRKHGIVEGAPAQQTWRVRLRDVPKARVQLLPSAGGITLDAQASEPSPARSRPLVRYDWVARPGNPAPLAGLPGAGQRLDLRAPTVDGEYYVTLRVTDADGRADESTAAFRVRDGVPRTMDLAREHAAWIDAAVVYGVVPALFGPHGLADVTTQLDRLSALGIDTLWLSPITASPAGDFGYAVTDHFHLRMGLGSEADLRELIRSAHVRGLRVIIDFVANHFSDQHAYFADTAAHGRASAYFDYFVRTETGVAAHYFDWRNLKNLDYRNAEVQQLVIEAFAHWVREFDVDGFRVDAAWGPRQRAPEFWPRWRQELKRIKPDLLLLAEASVGDAYYALNGFDAAYDWTDKLGEWAWHDAFQADAPTARRLRSAVAQSVSDALVFRFLDNNDTGARFITRHGPARTRVAAAMLLTLPGLPSLYTGDETGAAYEPYRDAIALDWTAPHELTSWYSRLIAMRRAQPALRSRDIRWLDVASSDQVLAYVRPGARAEDDITVLLNYGPAPMRLTLPDGVVPTGAEHSFIDLLTGSPVAFGGSGRAVVSLGGYEVRVLMRK